MTFIDAFLSSVAKYPNNIAVDDKNSAYTYRELGRRSGLAAEKIVAAAALQGTDLLKQESGLRVGILVPRTVDYFTAVLGVLRAGCAFVPLDTEYPAGRIAEITADAGCTLLLTTRELWQEKGLSEALTPEEPQVLFLEELTGKAMKRYNLSRPEAEAVLLYTSGSTGRPKGVVHSERIFLASCAPLDTHYEVTEQDHCCLMAGVTFIASFSVMFSILKSGGTVYIANESERMNPELLYGIICAKKITVMFMPPKLFLTLCRLYGELPLRCALLSGEKLTELPPEAKNIKVISVYGSTETGGVISQEVSGFADGLLGKPVVGNDIWLFDDDDELVMTPGVIGEACVASKQLALYYNKLPAETEAHFTVNPFTGSGRIFHTGDYMAWTADRRLEFHGRKDNMVKLRGFRVELGEVESALNRHPAVREAACLVKEINGGDKLCGFFELREGAVQPADAELKEFLKSSLPLYMVPDIFTGVEKLPRNANGKLDRLKLKSLAVSAETEAEYAAPVTELEQLICNEYARVLKLPQVSVLGDFFRLGGTSLSVAAFLPALEDAGYTVSYQDVYDNPTPRALADFLTAARDDERFLMELRDSYPLTKTQLGIYLECSISDSKETYTIPYLLEVKEGIAPEAVQEAVRAVLAVHPGMQFAIREDEDGKPRMYLQDGTKLPVPIVKGRAEARFDFIKEFNTPLEFGGDILLDFAVYQAEKRCYLALKSHLIVMDGTALGCLIAELNRALCGEKLHGEKWSLQQAALREEQQQANGSYDRAAAYFEKLLGEVPASENISGDVNETLTAGESKNFRFEPQSLDTERVRAFCAAAQITENAFFMGAMTVLLSKYLYSEQVTFSTVYDGRSLPQLKDTIGTLIKRIPVCGNLKKDTPVLGYLRDMGRQLFSTMSNDIYSFDEVLRHYNVTDEVEFLFQGDLFTGRKESDDVIKGDPYFIENFHTSMVTGLMSMQLFSKDGFYNLTIEYRNERLSESWVSHFASRLFLVAEKLLTIGTLGEIGLLTEAERAEIAGFNQTAVNIGFRPVTEQVKARAGRQPDKPAVIAAGRQLSFRELDLLSDKVATELTARGVKRGDIVAVLLDRDCFVYVAELGIMKAGAAFLPFVPGYPDERIDFCLQDSGSRFVITTKALAAERTAITGHKFLPLETIFSVATPASIRAKSNMQADCVHCEATDLAYCIYTSGTTGRPKGVMIEHGNIANYVHRNGKSVEVVHYAAPGRVCLALAALSFDVSVVEAFIPLCNGNTVVMATEEEIHTPAWLAELILKNRVTGITCTPTYLLSLLDLPETAAAMEQLTFFDIGAEAFPAALYDRLRSLRPDSVVLNVYGPTECTMGCAAKLMTSGQVVTIGEPIANTEFYVADKFGQPLPAGLKGELIISGDCVGRGYINLPDKTAEAFFTHEGRRAYHSGDLAAWTETGEVRIFGRIDNQIKLRGFRIELDEIEKVMGGFPGVKACAAAVKKFGDEEFLAGYFTADGDIDTEKLKEYMAEKLTEYMVPSAFEQLETMPQTLNGKIDRKALPEIDFAALKAEYIAPRDEVEQAICDAFCETLRFEKGSIGIKDDFFQLGGDSLKAMGVLSAAGLEGLFAKDIFQGRTAEQIAASYKERQGKGNPVELDMAARLTVHRVSPMQREMIDFQFTNLQATMWHNMAFLLRFKENIDICRLQATFRKVLNHHPALSMTFRFDFETGDIVQQYTEGILPALEIEETSEAELLAGAKELIAPFELMNSCLCRARLFKTDNGPYFFFDVHHWLMDGSSLDILLAEFVLAYEGKELQPDFYCAYLAEQDKIEETPEYAAAKKYYQDKYGGRDWCFILPPDFEVRNKFDLKSHSQVINVTLEEIDAAEKRLTVSRNVMAITAALNALYLATGRKNVMTNWIFSNRVGNLADDSVGMMIKNLPVGLNVMDYPNLRALLTEVQTQVVDGIANSSYDYFAEFSEAFWAAPMEVNYMPNMNGSEMDALQPEAIDLSTVTEDAGSRLEVNILENVDRKGTIISEFHWLAPIYKEENVLRYQKLFIREFEKIIKE